MLNLYFMRHAQTDCNNYDGNDFNRSLSRKGISETKKLLNFLVIKHISFDKIFYSPAVRTKETSDIVYKVMRLNISIGEPDITLYDIDFKKFLYKLTKLENYKNILLITHEPNIYSTIEFFFPGSHEDNNKTSILKFPTSSLTKITFDTTYLADILNCKVSYNFSINPDDIKET